MCIITDTYVKPLTVTCLRGTYYRPRSAIEAEKPVWLRSGALFPIACKTNIAAKC